jgi:GDPmannose 4,6-dehydratase
MAHEQAGPPVTILGNFESVDIGIRQLKSMGFTSPPGPKGAVSRPAPLLHKMISEGLRKKMKKALIVGVAGQDGAYMAELLLKKNYHVAGTSRNAETASIKNLSFLAIDKEVELLSMALSDFRSVLQVIDKVKPDEIYNLAGQTSVGLSFEQPVETFNSITVGTLNLLEVLRFYKLPIKLYNACSSECFGDTDGYAANEMTPFHPLSPYAVAKSAAYWAVANYRDAYNLFASSGILFNHESPLRNKRFVTKKIISTACRIAGGSREKLKLGNIDVQRDWGWAPEYVEAMWKMLQLAKTSDYVIATGMTHTLSDFIAIAFSKLGLDWKEHIEISNDLYRPTDIMISKADPSRARDELGWAPKYKMHQIVEMLIEAERSIIQ